MTHRKGSFSSLFLKNITTTNTKTTQRGRSWTGWNHTGYSPASQNDIFHELIVLGFLLNETLSDFVYFLFFYKICFTQSAAIIQSFPSIRLKDLLDTKDNRWGNPDTCWGRLRWHIQTEVLTQGIAAQNFSMIVQNIEFKMNPTLVLVCSLLSSTGPFNSNI